MAAFLSERALRVCCRVEASVLRFDMDCCVEPKIRWRRCALDSRSAQIYVQQDQSRSPVVFGAEARDFGRFALTDFTGGDMSKEMADDRFRLFLAER